MGIKIKPSLAAIIKPDKVARLTKIFQDHDYGRLLFMDEPDEDDMRLLDTYPDQIKSFRTFMQEKVYPDAGGQFDNTHFAHFSFGFFCALGVPFPDSSLLSIFCRYNLQDFDPALGKES